MKRFVFLVGCLAVLVLLGGPAEASRTRSRVPRSGFLIEIDDVFAGYASDVRGAAFTLGPTGTSVDPIEIEFGLGMEPNFYAWIDEALRGLNTHHAVRVRGFRAGDGSREGGNGVSVTFFDPEVLEIGLPRLQRGDKGAARMTAKIAPPIDERSTGFHVELDPSFAPEAALKDPTWPSSGFTFSLQGYPPAQVARIAPATIAVAGQPPAADLSVTVELRRGSDGWEFLFSELAGSGGGPYPDQGELILRNGLGKPLYRLSLADIHVTGVKPFAVRPTPAGQDADPTAVRFDLHVGSLTFGPY